MRPNKVSLFVKVSVIYHFIGNMYKQILKLYIPTLFINYLLISNLFSRKYQLFIGKIQNLSIKSRFTKLIINNRIYRNKF